MNLRKQGLMARLQSPVEDDGEDTGGTDTVIEDEEVSEETVEETPEEVVVTIGE